MAKPLTGKARSFYGRYVEGFDDLLRAAELLERLAREALRSHNFDLHLVSARAKDSASVLKKIRQKGYGDPARQLTDQVGLRVITYYESDVDKVASVLRSSFEVDETRSEDKRLALGLREFGYRSLHMVARLADASDWSPLKGKWFEIQVRSLLEHAWAEIEHELVYKSGIVFPEAVRRRFNALAGAAEVLDQQFLVLRDERSSLIDRYRETYAAGNELDVTLDAARLLGFLEAERPSGRSWRTAESLGFPFPPRIESTCVEVLDACEVRTATDFRTVLGTKAFRDAAGDLASAEAIADDEISHLAVVVLAVGSVNPQLLHDEFLDMRPTIEAYVPSLAVPS